VPALIMQRDMTKIGLEPIGRSAPGTEGVVDIYLLPAYDDVATLYLIEGRWVLNHPPSEDSDSREAVSEPLTKSVLGHVMDQLARRG